MKRYSCCILFLALLLMTGMLAGCGGNNPPATPAPAAPAPTTPAPTAPAVPAYEITRPVEILVAFNPGGTYDGYSRVMQPYFEESLEKITGQDVTVIITNLAGGSGRIAYTEIFRERDKDAPRLILMASNAQMFSIVDEESTFNVEEYNFLGNINNDLHYILLRNDMEINTFDEFVAATQQNPLLFGTSGIGASEMMHGYFMTDLMAKHNVDVPFDYVNYTGAGEITAGFLANDIEMTMGNTLNTSAYLAQDAAKPFAVFARERSADYPDIPTLIELGCPEDVVATIEDVLKVSFRFVASPNMDPALVEIFRDAIRDCYSNPDFVAEAKEKSLNVDFVEWDQDLTNAKATGEVFLQYADLLKTIFAQ